MRALMPLVAVGLAALVLQACAGERSTAIPRDILLDSLEIDSVGAAILDGLFTEKYGAVTAMLADREADGAADLAAIEARALVAAAEEMFLHGRTHLALQLLDDAAVLLRRNR
jgi:hypothetical protein